MARALRIEHAGGWYHVTARGNERHDIYRDPADRRHFCELLGEMASQLRLRFRREPGQAVGGPDYVSVSLATKLFEHRLQHDRRLAQLTKEVRERL